MQLRGFGKSLARCGENLDQVLGGLDDGLLLFSLDGRAVMVSPAAERFWPCRQIILWPPRGRIFSSGSSVREAIKLHDGEFDRVESAEVVLSGRTRRHGVSA